MGVKFPGRVEDTWQCPSMKAATRFTDRAPESEALRESLRVHRRAIDGDQINGIVMNNILVFYGVGGVGKSTLSEHMEAWITGKLPADFHWGEPPTGLKVVTVRWDLRSEQQLTSPVPFYLNLRCAMAQAGFSTPNFDVGVAVLGARFKISVAHEGDHYAELADDLAAEVLRDALPEVPAMSIEQQAAGLRPGRYLLTQISDPAVLESLEGIHGDLPAALKTVLRGEASVDRLKEAVQMVGWMLSEDIQRLPTAERPLPVAFLDTFEKLRNRTLTRDEEVVNSVVGALPYCLFVVTGRLLVGWADPKRTELQHAGPATWPSLARTRASEPEPRQHLVGTLDEEDARDVLEYCMAGIDAPFEDDLVASLARTTQLPEHIDATVILARRFALSNPGGTLTLAALGGSFKDVVERLMEHLSPQQAQLLQAAATTPQFDIPLVAAMAQVPYAVAEQAMDNPLVQRLVGQDFFPYHLHDEIRRLVTEAGPEVRHAWTPLDRREAAQRGLDHLEGRLRKTIDEDLILERIAVQALAFGLCADYSMEPEWVIDEFQNTPSHGVLQRSLMDFDRLSERLGEVVKLSRLIMLTARSRLTGLKEFASQCKNSDLRRVGERWIAASHRGLREFREALELYESLWEETGDELYATNIVITLRMQGRHREALSAYLSFGDQAGMPLAGLFNNYGLFAEASEHSAVRLAQAQADQMPRRWLAELQCMLVSHRCWLGAAGNGEVELVYRQALALDRNDGQRLRWQWRAIRNLYNRQIFESSWAALLRLRDRDGLMPRQVKECLFLVGGLSALANGSVEYVDRIRRDVGDSISFPPAHLIFLWGHLADLGLVSSPLTAVEPQWIGDREEVKQRWIAIFHRLIDEARARNEGVIDE